MTVEIDCGGLAYHDMDELRRLFESGNESALNAAAVACCHPTAAAVAVPSWVLAALIDRQAEYMAKLAPGRGGRGGPGWHKGHWKDFVHAVRCSEVNRGLQKGLSEAEACRQAEDKLKGTQFMGSAAAIKKSVELVRHLWSERPEEATRRFWFGSPVMAATRKK
jgi:hypothetical protein